MSEINDDVQSPGNKKDAVLCRTIIARYHELKGRKMWIDHHDRCYGILQALFIHWSLKGRVVPWTVIKFEVIGTEEFKKIKSPMRTFSNNLRLLIKLGLVEKINGAGYLPTEMVKEAWRKA
jgi:hypothetical protein